MRTKWFLFMVSTLIILGQSVSASAAWVSDTCGDELAAIGADIEQAKVTVLPETAPYEEIELCVDMCSGSGLPGMIIWEFDVDSDTATGEGTMLEMPFSPCKEQPNGWCKDLEGIDLVIQKWLRRQADDSQTAWSKNCEGTGSSACAIKNPAATAVCNEGTCYEILDFCNNEQDPDCKELSDSCTGCVDDLHPFDSLPQCSGASCARGTRAGDWQALINEIGGVLTIGGHLVDWGRDRVSPPAGDPASPLECKKFPWRRILEEAKAEGAEFDLTAALNNPPKFQVSVWHDPDFGDDEDDFFENFIPPHPPPRAIHVNDWLPEGDGIMANGENDDPYSCDGDFEPDGDVDGTDAFRFKSSFGRRNCDEL